MSEATTPAGGYRLVLPPGWQRFAVREASTEASMHARLDAAATSAPRDSVAPHLARAKQDVTDMLAQARRAGALDLYAPFEGVRGRAVPASFVVKDVLLDEPGDPTADAGARPSSESSSGPAAMVAGVTAALVTRLPGAEVVALPAGAAVRVARTTPPGPGEAGWGARHVDYHLAVPGDSRRWLTSTFTVSEGDPAAADGQLPDLLVGLFDAVMTTWRWTPGLLL